MDLLTSINTVLWVTGNLVVLSIFLSAMAFAVLYPAWFNPALTTGGKLIWRAILSVAGFGLLVVIGLFIDGSVAWWQIPPTVDPARPIVRLVIYGFIAYTFASLVVLLVKRKWFPSKLKTAPRPHIDNIPDDDTIGPIPRR